MRSSVSGRLPASSLVFRALLWAAIGAVVGTSLDALHVLTGAVIYPSALLGLQPGWVPFLYAGAGLGLGLGHRFGAARVAGPLPAASAGEAAAGVAALVVVYGSSGFLRHWPTAALVAYLMLFAAAVAWTPASARRALLLHAAGAALIGPLVEFAISSAGGFAHAAPDFLGVPRWLPAIYLHAAVASAAVDRWLSGRVAGK